MLHTMLLQSEQGDFPHSDHSLSLSKNELHVSNQLLLGEICMF